MYDIYKRNPPADYHGSRGCPTVRHRESTFLQVNMVAQVKKNIITACIGISALVFSVLMTWHPANAATCVTSATDGICGPYDTTHVWGNNGGPEVVQDWQNKSVGSQKLTASAPDNWNVLASMPAGNTSVVSYPDVRNDYTPGSHPTALSSFPTLATTFSQVDPTGTGQDYEWAYDIWLASTSQPSWQADQEIMLWTDNHGQRPAGNDSGISYTDPGGVKWEVWTWAGSNTVSSSYQTVSLVRSSNEASGSLDLASVIAWLESSGYTSTSAGIDQVDYGLEICSTGGTVLQYALTSYTFGVTSGPVPTPTQTAIGTPGGLSQTAHVIVNFGWQGIPGWTGTYEFMLTGSAGAIVADRTVTGTHVSSVQVNKNTAYQWRVRATGGPWSVERAFVSP